jgi:hypothetical protein
MFRLLAFLVILSALVLSSFPIPTRSVRAQTGIPTAVLDAKNAMVLIEIPNATGSGFVIKGGYVVTNCHVVRGAAAIQVHFWAGKTREAGRQALCAPKDDVAYIAASIPADAHQLEFATEPAVQGQDVWLWSFPLGTDIAREPSLSRGIISSVETVHGFLNLDITGAPGSSGGAVIDANGRAVAIYTGSWVAGQQVSGYRVAVPAAKASGHLANLPTLATPTTTAPGGGTSASIRPGDGIGPVRIGMNHNQVIEAIGLPPTGRDMCAVWATRMLHVCYDKGKAVVIISEDPSAQTAEGIKVGSSDVDLIKAYGAPVCATVRAYTVNGQSKTYLTWFYEGMFAWLEGKPRRVVGLLVVPPGLARGVCN